MKRRRYLYCFFATVMMLEVCSCGKKQDIVSTEVEETEEAAIIGSAKTHEYLGFELELLKKSEIEELEFEKYVKLGDYSESNLVTEEMAKTVADQESTFEEKEETLDKLLTDILEKSVVSGDLSAFYDQLEIQKTVYYMNQAEAENMTLEEYAANQNFDSYESFLKFVEEEAKETVDKMVVTYAMAEELQIELSDEEYIEGAEVLKKAYGMESLEELLDLYGTEQVRWMIMAYGTNGVTYKLIALDAKKMGIEVEETPDTSSNTSSSGNSADTDAGNIDAGNGNTGGNGNSSGNNNNSGSANGSGDGTGSGTVTPGETEQDSEDDTSDKTPQNPPSETETEENSETEEPENKEDTEETEEPGTEENETEPGTETVIPETEEP